VARAAIEGLKLERVAARHVVPRLRLAEPSADAFRRNEVALEREVSRIARSDGPVIVGPWLSEVGLEILYWIPFLRRLVDRFELDPARLTVVSRGGVESWYAGIGGGYVDVFDLVDEAAFREGLRRSWAEYGGQKQIDVGSFDREVTLAAAERAGLRGPHLLHPSLMYRLFSEYWLHRISLPAVLEHLEIRAFEPPEPDGWVAELPDDYVAARFYFRETFPDTEAHRELVASILERLAAAGPVVLLDTGLELDDHAPAPMSGRGLLRPLAGVAAAENLHAQSVVVGRARAFVGTYGGLCYLANAYGVPALALLAPPAKKLGLSHTAVARRLSAAGGAPLSIVATTALEALAGGVARAGASREPSSSSHGRGGR
jgi:hypothetical protein